MYKFREENEHGRDFGSRMNNNPIAQVRIYYFKYFLSIFFIIIENTLRRRSKYACCVITSRQSRRILSLFLHFFFFAGLFRVLQTGSDFQRIFQLVLEGKWPWSLREILIDLRTIHIFIHHFDVVRIGPAFEDRGDRLRGSSCRN